MTDITHERASTIFADYDLEWEDAGRLVEFDFDSLFCDDCNADYAPAKQINLILHARLARVVYGTDNYCNLQ